MRITLEQGINNCQLIYDTYQHDLTALEKVLAFTHRQTDSTRWPCTVLLTDLPLSDPDRPHLYRQLANLLATQKVYRLIAIGPELDRYAALFALPYIHFYPDMATLLASHQLNDWVQNIVIVKNNPTYELESLYNRLRQKNHKTILEINLDAIAQNIQFIRNKLVSTTQIIAVVKAITYGSSYIEVAQFLQSCQIAYLAVCYADEGVFLRKKGIHLPIMVMNPAAASFDRLLTYNLEPVLYSLSILKAWDDFIHDKKVGIPCHIKLDTGMHRLGFMPEENQALCSLLHNRPHLTVKSVCSHWAAPTPAHADYTHSQAALFQQLAHGIEEALGRPVLKHLSNTAGIYHFPAYQFDMVRVGIGLYGIGNPALTIAITFKTVVAQIKTVPAGATIGYDRQGIARQPTQLAILAIGYADGLRYSLSNGKGHVWIKGQVVPIIGRVCMDMAMVDVTGLDVQEGDEAIIYGPDWPIEHIVKATDTIAHEILTNVGARVRRIYFTTF